MKCKYTLRYYLSIMKKEVKKFAVKWNKLEKFVQSEVFSYADPMFKSRVLCA